MSTSIRQQRQALRRQRRQQRQAQRQVRRRAVSPHLSRRVRMSDLNSLDERQRLIAQAILSRRQQVRQQLEQSAKQQSEDASTEQEALESSLLSDSLVTANPTDSHAGLTNGTH